MIKMVVKRMVSLMALGGVTLVCVGGCCCVPPPPPCDPEEDESCEDGIQIAFVFPRDGFALNVADDADEDTSNGIQVDPPVRVAYGGGYPDGGGPLLTLSSDQGEVATAVVEADGFARFIGFTLSGSDEVTPVELTVTDGDHEDVIDIDVVLEDPDPEPDPLDDGGLPDAADADAGEGDGGAMDAGEADAGPLDPGVIDAGGIDAGLPDGGLVDGGE